MNKAGSITVDIDVRMNVSRDTAEGCLKIVEMFINSNSEFRVHDASNDDGTRSLYLVDYSFMDEQAERKEE